MDQKALHCISYGVYIISSSKEGKKNGQIANCLMQITNDPVSLAVSVNKANLTHEFIQDSELFSVSILEKETPLKLIGRFGFKSGRESDKFEGISSEVLMSGCPVVTENALCWLGAKVINKMDCGTYTLFLGEVTEAEVVKQGEAMTYDYYHKVKCGATPNTAPTFIEGEEEQAACAGMPRYRCTVCNYIYNPAVGDPDGGIPPGTAFEAIPDSWVCPICGVGKDKFVEEG